MPVRPRYRSAVLAAAFAPASILLAQTHRVAKPEKVTRALAVYEWTGDLNKPTASRLVPVSLFIDGHLEDAGVYLPRPVPFALQPGNVYAIEKAGEPVGTLDLDGARNIVSNHSPDESPAGAWYAFGHFQPPPAAAKAPVLHTTAHPGAIVASSAEGRPHIASRSSSGDSADTTPEKSPTAKPSAPSTGTPSGPSAPAPIPASSDDDADRPHMSRRDHGASAADDNAQPARTGTGSTSSTTSAPTSSDDDPERPTLRRRSGEPEKKKRSKESGSGVIPMATSLNDDPDRPTLSRGSLNTPSATPELTGMPADMHQAVAVSDATTIDNHPFAREWESETERVTTLAAVEQLARPRVANYLATNALHPGTAFAAKAQAAAAKETADRSAPAEGGPPKIQRGRPVSETTAESSKPSPHNTPAAPAHTQAHARGRATTSAAAPLLLAHEQLSGFTLSYGGLPVFVYSASTPTAEGPAVHITTVAQQLPSGELQLALSSVTDEAHLNRDPQLRLVDVVDPNDSHRASLLFELRGKQGRQFALYNLVTAKAEQAFTTGLIP